MKMTAKGFDVIREHFGKLSESQVGGINRIVDACHADGEITYPQGAYILATIWHETGGNMKPIAEWGKGKGRPYGTWYTNSKGVKYSYKNGSKKTVYTFDECPHLFYGRGDTQNTWYDNYEKLSKVFQEDFLKNPDLLLTEKWSTPVTIYSMKTGLYTSKKLTDYINANKTDFINARRIINGTDKAQKIAKEAEVFLVALRKP